MACQEVRSVEGVGVKPSSGIKRRRNSPRPMNRTPPNTMGKVMVKLANRTLKPIPTRPP